MRRGGFTFIELLISLAIIATLASIAYPLSELKKQRGREQELQSALREIRAALDAFKQAGDEGRIQRSGASSGYPSSLDDLVRGVEDVKDPQRKSVYFLRRIPRDPMHTDPAVASHLTWRKRSYASPADMPAEGADVFDVYSGSEKAGLNGVPYKEW